MTLALNIWAGEVYLSPRDWGLRLQVPWVGYGSQCSPSSVPDILEDLAGFQWRKLWTVSSGHVLMAQNLLHYIMHMFAQASTHSRKTHTLLIHPHTSWRSSWVTSYMNAVFCPQPLCHHSGRHIFPESFPCHQWNCWLHQWWWLQQCVSTAFISGINVCEWMGQGRASV